MDAKDLKILRDLSDDNWHLRKLMSAHEAYEVQLEEFGKRPALSADEAIKKKKIQKMKLAGRDEMQRILDEHRAKEI